MTILEITAWSFGSIIAAGTLLTWIHDRLEARFRRLPRRATGRSAQPRPAVGRRRTLPVAGPTSTTFASALGAAAGSAPSGAAASPADATTMRTYRLPRRTDAVRPAAKRSATGSR